MALNKSWMHGCFKFVTIKVAEHIEYQPHG